MTGAEQTRNFCALGSQQTVLGIRRAVPIVHSGSACCLRLHQGISGCNGYQGMGFSGGCAIPNDNIHRPDFVYGSEKKLADLIEGTIRVMDADLYVVLTGCNVELAGDDTRGVVNSFRKRGVPIVAVETAGFKGGIQYGHELVMKAIVEQLDLCEQAVIDNQVNLWMTVPYADPFWSGNIEKVAAILTELGFSVNCLFGMHSSVNAWRRIPAARFNLLLAPWAGLEIVQMLRERFGTPYFHYPSLPVGAGECRNFLLQLARFAGLADAMISRYISPQDERYYYYLERASDLLICYRRSFPERFFTIADVFYAAGISKCLFHDFGLMPGWHYLTDEPPGSFRQSIRECFTGLAGAEKQPPVSYVTEIEDVGADIKKRAAGFTPLILGSSWEEAIAAELRGYFFEISAPVSERLIMDCSYVGYRGGLRLAEEVFSTMLKGGS